MLVLLVLALFIVGLVAAMTKAPERLRTLAVPLIAVALVVTSVSVVLNPSTSSVVAVAAVAVAAGVLAASIGSGWRYVLSFLVPMPMISTYTLNDATGSRREQASWLQFRGRVMRHRATALPALG